MLYEQLLALFTNSSVDIKYIKAALQSHRLALIHGTTRDRHGTQLGGLVLKKQEELKRKRRSLQRTEEERELLTSLKWIAQDTPNLSLTAADKNNVKAKLVELLLALTKVLSDVVKANSLCLETAVMEFVTFLIQSVLIDGYHTDKFKKVLDKVAAGLPEDVKPSTTLLPDQYKTEVKQFIVAEIFGDDSWSDFVAKTDFAGRFKIANLKGVPAEIKFVVEKLLIQHEKFGLLSPRFLTLEEEEQIFAVQGPRPVPQPPCDDVDVAGDSPATHTSGISCDDNAQLVYRIVESLVLDESLDNRHARAAETDRIVPGSLRERLSHQTLSTVLGPDFDRRFIVAAPTPTPQTPRQQVARTSPPLYRQPVLTLWLRQRSKRVRSCHSRRRKRTMSSQI